MALLLATFLGWYFYQKGPTLGQVERRVRADVPLGSPRAQVETWLHGNKIEFVSVEGATESLYGKDRVVDLANLPTCQVGTTIRAIIEPAFVDPFWYGEVDVYFFFDQQGLLIGYTFIPWAHAL